MISVSVSIPLSDEDRAFLRELLDYQPGPEPEAAEVAHVSENESETDEFQELSKIAHAKAKALLDTKDPEKVAVVKAALDKVGLERVTHMTTVKQVKAFTKALG